MVSTELGRKQLPASLSTSPCASPVGMSGHAMAWVKLAGWWLPALFEPEAVRTDLLPRWLILLLLHTTLCCIRRSSPCFCDREAFFSSISHHSSFVKIMESLRLEKTSKTTKSNRQPITTTPAKPCPEVPYLCIFWTPPGMVTPPLPWALPVPLPDHSLNKEVFPNIQSEPPLVQLETISSRPIAGYLGEEIIRLQ